MSDRERQRAETAIYNHLNELTMAPGDASWMAKVPKGILADPQAHIDALVEAGVLERASVVTYVNNPNGIGQTIRPGYLVVAPHVHEWRVSDTEPVRSDDVRLFCADHHCSEARYVPNRLPIEVPE